MTQAALQELAQTRASVQQFQTAAYAHYGSYSYSAGYLESTVVDLIMQLPKHKRAEMRQLFAQQVQKLCQTVDTVAV